MNPDRIRLVERWVGATVGFVLTDIAGLGGAGLLSYGAWQVYHPAGFMAGGALLLAGAWLSARGAR